MSVLPDALIRHAAAVEAEMRATVDAAAATGGLQLPIHDMARYALGWIDQHGAPAAAAGKRARPALCMLGAAAITPDHERQAPALCGAAAVEFVHNFSLVHDDIQDQDEQRRGRPTVWKVWVHQPGDQRRRRAPRVRRPRDAPRCRRRRPAAGHP